MIAGVPVPEVNFAVVNETGPAFEKEGGGGILGIGFDGFQIAAGETGCPLPALLDQMKAQGTIPA